jgi:hypothetical protein
MNTNNSTIRIPRGSTGTARQPLPNPSGTGDDAATNELMPAHD